MLTDDQEPRIESRKLAGEGRFGDKRRAVFDAASLVLLAIGLS